MCGPAPSPLYSATDDPFANATAPFLSPPPSPPPYPPPPEHHHAKPPVHPSPTLSISVTSMPLLPPSIAQEPSTPPLSSNPMTDAHLHADQYANAPPYQGHSSQLSNTHQQQPPFHQMQPFGQDIWPENTLGIHSSPYCYTPQQQQQQQQAHYQQFQQYHQSQQQYRHHSPSPPTSQQQTYQFQQHPQHQFSVPNSPSLHNFSTHPQHSSVLRIVPAPTPTPSSAHASPYPSSASSSSHSSPAPKSATYTPIQPPSFAPLQQPPQYHQTQYGYQQQYVHPSQLPYPYPSTMIT